MISSCWSPLNSLAYATRASDSIEYHPPLLAMLHPAPAGSAGQRMVLTRSPKQLCQYFGRPSTGKSKPGRRRQIHREPAMVWWLPSCPDYWSDVARARSACDSNGIWNGGQLNKISKQRTYSKNSLAGLVELYEFCSVTGRQLSVFHGLPHDVQGSS